MGVIFAELRKPAKKYGVDIRSRAWPKGPAQLSRRIGELTRLLEKAEVNVEIGRRSGGERYIILAREKNGDDDGESPSQRPSPSASMFDKPLYAVTDAPVSGSMPSKV